MGEFWTGENVGTIHSRGFVLFTEAYGDALNSILVNKAGYTDQPPCVE